MDLLEYKEVSTEEGKKFAETHGFYFMETSAKENINVKKAFDVIVNKTFEKIKEKERMEQERFRGTISSGVNIEKIVLPQKKGCCS